MEFSGISLSEQLFVIHPCTIARPYPVVSRTGCSHMGGCGPTKGAGQGDAGPTWSIIAG